MFSTVQKLLAAALLSLTMMGCQQQAQQPEEKFAPMVKTQIVQSQGMTGMREFPGTVIANQRVDLAFQVPGQLKTFPVVNGQQVKRNEVLATLDAVNYQNDYDEVLARYNKAKRDLVRAAELLKSGTISESMYDDRREKNDVAAANLETALKNLSDTKLVAPFGGVVAKTYVENFQNVEAKQRVLSLQDIETVDILIDVPERDVALAKRDKLRHGRRLEHKVKFETLPGRAFEVDIKEFAMEADQITQTYKVTLTMRVPEGVFILPGMTAMLYVDMSKVSGAEIQIPSHAVAIDKTGQKYVWLLDSENNEVHKKVVTVGEVVGDLIIIDDGLQVGEEIVVSGVSHLSEGMQVRLFSDFLNQE